MSAKTYLCSKVKIAFFEDVESLTNSDIILQDGKQFLTLEGDDLLFKEQYVNADNDYVNQTLSLKKFTDVDMLNKLFYRRLLVKLYFTGGGVMVWGSLTKFVRMASSDTTTNESAISFNRKTERFEYNPIVV